MGACVGARGCACMSVHARRCAWMRVDARGCARTDQVLLAVAADALKHHDTAVLEAARIAALAQRRAPALALLYDEHGARRLRPAHAPQVDAHAIFDRFVHAHKAQLVANHIPCAAGPRAHAAATVAAAVAAAAGIRRAPLWPIILRRARRVTDRLRGYLSSACTRHARVAAGQQRATPNACQFVDLHARACTPSFARLPHPVRTLKEPPAGAAPLSPCSPFSPHSPSSPRPLSPLRLSSPRSPSITLSPSTHQSF